MLLEVMQKIKQKMHQMKQSNLQPQAKILKVLPKCKLGCIVVHLSLSKILKIGGVIVIQETTAHLCLKESKR